MVSKPKRNYSGRQWLLGHQPVTLSNVRSYTAYYLIFDANAGIGCNHLYEANVSNNQISIPLSFLFFPQVVSQPKSTIAKIGDAAAFSVRATGDSPITYQWQFNGLEQSSSEIRLPAIIHTVSIVP